MYAARASSRGFASLTPWAPLVGRPRLWRWRWQVLGVVTVVLLLTGYVRLATDGRVVAASSKSVTVAPGDTLWGIAARRYPAADPREKVLQIERLNALDGPAIEPGQRLRLPAG